MKSADKQRVLSLTPRDRQILGFLAEHHLALEGQLAALTGSCAKQLQPRLRALARAGYVRQHGVLSEACYSILQLGLTAVGSSLPPPRLILSTYKHDVGTAWLWLAAQRGAFGPVAEILGERRVRSHDEAAAAPDDLHSVRLGGYDENGRQRRHYPDLLLVDRQGQRLALELELSSKKAFRRDQILAAYGADRRLDGVLYLVEANAAGRAIGRGVMESAARMRLEHRIHVRLVTPIELERSGSRGSTRAAATRRRPAQREAAR